MNLLTLPFTVAAYIIGAGVLCGMLALWFITLGLTIFAIVYPIWSMLRWAVRRVVAWGT